MNPEMKKAFDEWFYSAEHRKKYDCGSTGYLAALESWQAATEAQDVKVWLLKEEVQGWKDECDLVMQVADMIGHDKDLAEIKELAMLVKRLSSALRVAVPKSRLAASAMDYLRRYGIEGSPMREKENTNER
jgi:hypothetical protein